MSARQLTGDDDVAVLDQDLNRHTAVFVVLQTIRHNRICDLIADLIGMAIAYLFTSDDFHFPFLSATHLWPFGPVPTCPAPLWPCQPCRFLHSWQAQYLASGNPVFSQGFGAYKTIG